MTLKSFLKHIYLFRPPLKANRVIIFIVLSVCAFTVIFLLFRDLPSPRSLTQISVPLTTHIRDRNGVELYKIYKNQNRTLVKLNDIPESLRQAILSIEDSQFYSHNGFSLSGTVRAATRILTKRSFEGGSTITQQLVKTSLLSPERTVYRKLRELLLALAVETLYSKDQILEMYLNRVSFGGTSFGVEEAARTYFGKSVSSLNLAEASFLAGLPASPTTYSPFGAYPELAKNRQKEVLRRMVENRYITWEQAEVASGEELVFMPPQTDIKAPHFVMYIKDLLAQKYGSHLIEQGGLDVTTSLDIDIQDFAQKIIAEETAKIANLHITNGAALITNPKSGEILAMVGSRNYFDTKNDGQVNVTRSLRQSGSAIKPLNYALAFSKNFTPASIIDDSPITYRIAGLPPYSPANYDNRYHGRITLRTALASSYNIPAVKLLSANGINNLINLGQKMGITTWNDPSRFGLSLTLGGGEITMMDLTTAYGVFANSGNRTNLNPILSVRDSKGRIIEKNTATPEPILDPKIAFLINDILSDNAARTPTFGSRSQLNIPKVAVKTGTSNNLRDNWTIGYTPDFVVSVWVGNNDNSPMSYVASGVTGASPIWNKITTELLEKMPSPGFTPPSELIKINICMLTGQLACTSCPTRSEYFLPNTEPKSACTEEQINQIVYPTPYPQPTPQILGRIIKQKWPRPTTSKTH